MSSSSKRSRQFQVLPSGLRVSFDLTYSPSTLKGLPKGVKPHLVDLHSFRLTTLELHVDGYAEGSITISNPIQQKYFCRQVERKSAANNLLIKLRTQFNRETMSPGDDSRPLFSRKDRAAIFYMICPEYAPKALSAGLTFDAATQEAINNYYIRRQDPGVRPLSEGSNEDRPPTSLLPLRDMMPAVLQAAQSQVAAEKTWEPEEAYAQSSEA